MSESPRYFEDFETGQVIDLGSFPAIDEGDMSAFSAHWDPGVHARPSDGSPSDLPAASGWYVGAITMKLLVEGLLNQCAAEGSPGLDRLDFLADVHPGDVLSGRYTVLDASPSASRPTIGKLRARIEAYNQRQERVLAIEAMQFMGRRP
ncbi:MAG: hypothetical protein QOJ23_4631 [Actinomycetota bacterium]|nr:hypothetical protein [Actinomycetota bacterium]